MTIACIFSISIGQLLKPAGFCLWENGPYGRIRLCKKGCSAEHIFGTPRLFFLEL